MGSLPVSKFIQSMIVFYLIAWTISPPLQINTIYRIVALVAAVLWFILDVPNKVKYDRIHYYSILFLFMVAIIALIEGKGEFESLLRPINLYMLVFAFLMAYCYKDRWNELTPLIPVVMILLIYFNYKSYQAVVDDPAIARLIVRNDTEVYSYMRDGVGGYGLLYPQVCVLPVFVYWTINACKKNIFKFSIGIVWAVSFFLYMLNSGYSIAIFTSIVSLVILLFYKRESITLAIVITAIILFLVIWLIGYVDGFRNSLLEFFDGTTVAKKINDIYESITTDETADSIGVRTDAYANALGDIFHFPIIGGLWWESGGGHSALLDIIAKYGVFGGYIFCTIVFNFSNSLKKNSKDKRDISLANAFFISTLMIVLLNSLPYNLVFMIIIVVPMCYNDILKWRKTDENTLDGKSYTNDSFKRIKY